VIPIDCAQSNISITIDSVAPATSCSTNNGIIYVTGNGGTPPYQYIVNNQTHETADLAGLSAGIYPVSIVDANGCEAIANNVVVPADGLQFSIALKADSACFSNNGSVTISVIEGKRPFQFGIQDGTFSNDSVFTGLSHGTYIVKAKDNDGCVIDLNVSIPRGNTEVRWALDIKPLFTTYCATQGCHNGISRTNDFRKYTWASRFANDIKVRTGNRSMPFNGSLTQHQIDLIACWVDDGAPEN
jgi:hypothetical protein